MNITPRILLTGRQAAEALHVSERTLFTLRREGVIPFVKLGGQIRYRIADIEGALDKLQSRTSSEGEVR